MQEDRSHQSSAEVPPADLPVPPAGNTTDDPKGKDKTGYGHIGNKDVPRPEGAPKPHQIF
jgi:hypothetical protein